MRLSESSGSSTVMGDLRTQYGTGRTDVAAQRAVQDALRPFEQDGRAGKRRVIRDVALILGQVTIRHGLKRVPLGWSLVDLQSAAVVHRVSWSSTELVLESNAAATAAIEVW